MKRTRTLSWSSVIFESVILDIVNQEHVFKIIFQNIFCRDKNQWTVVEPVKPFFCVWVLLYIYAAAKTNIKGMEPNNSTLFNIKNC